MIVAILVVGGVIMTMLGVIGEYVWRIFDEVRGRPLYLVARDSAQKRQELEHTMAVSIPLPVTVSVQEAQEMALLAYRTLDCTGLARVDFLLNDLSKTLYLNELNTMPGFTPISMYGRLWEASGLKYSDLLDKMIGLAQERFADRQRNAVEAELGAVSG